MGFLAPAFGAIGGLFGAASSARNLFGGGGGGSPSATVDPVALAQAQTGTNLATAETQARLNNLNTFSPYGSTTYEASAVDPVTGLPSSYNVNQTLSPDLAGLFDTQTGLARTIADTGGRLGGRAGDIGDIGYDFLSQGAAGRGNLAGGLDTTGIPVVGGLTPADFRTDVTGGAGGQALPGAVTGAPLTTDLNLQTALPLQTGLDLQTKVNSDFPELVRQAQDAAYKSQTQYLDPQFSQAEESLTQRLGDQGLEPGGAAYSRAAGDFARQKQQAYDSARAAAVAAGNEQQRALFGQALAGGEFANQALQAGGQFRNQALLAGGQFTNQALAAGGDFRNRALLAGAGLTNQARGQLFGEGMSLADLFNQSRLAASGQNLQAQQANLGRAQALFNAPYSATGNLLNYGTSLYGAGTDALSRLLAGVTAWPTGPTGIPSLAPGTATGVSPTNVAAAQTAATNQARTALLSGQTNLENLYNFGAGATRGLTGLSQLFGGDTTPTSGSDTFGQDFWG
jgi:hypothetical protein